MKNIGRKATAEEALQANAEASVLEQKIRPLNLKSAADYIEQHPPSAEAIATLPYLLLDVSEAERKRIRKVWQDKGLAKSIESRQEAAARKEAEVSPYSTGA